MGVTRVRGIREGRGWGRVGVVIGVRGREKGFSVRDKPQKRVGNLVAAQDLSSRLEQGVF